jgi:biopolymer transport protein ExbD
MRQLFSSAPAGEVGLSTAAFAPMVDLFTTLLVVLLRTWSTDMPLETVEEGMELPISQSEEQVGRGIAIDIGPEGIYVEGWRSGSSKYWSESDEVLIREVHEALQARRGKAAVIRAHKDAPWNLLGKVLFTAQQAGYSDIQLVATSQASL